MVKSKILKKVLLFLLIVVSFVTFNIVYFAIPKVTVTVNNLEEVNAKQTLNNVISIIDNVYKDIDLIEKYSLETHKVHLKELTETVWSVIETKYEESKPENIGNVLIKRSKKFNEKLTEYYLNNKDKMSEDELKRAIKNYIKVYRYNDDGYFFAINNESVLVAHPNSKIDGKSYKNINEKSDVSLIVNEILNLTKTKDTAFIEYLWKNPSTNKNSKKLTYVFKFKPYNWTIATGEHKEILKLQLKNEVIELVDKLRYRHTNYFFISDYNNILLSHPTEKGKNLSNKKDLKGNLVLPETIKLAKSKGETYYEYWLEGELNGLIPTKKLSYVKDFPNWEMVIGTNILLNNINKVIEERQNSLLDELKEIVMSTKIGKSGYLYVFDHKGNVVFHPNSNVHGKNFYNFKNPSSDKSIGEDLINAAINGNGTLEYKWDKPDDKGNYVYDKVSWIKYLPKEKLYVASSIYIDDLERSSKELTVQTLIFSSTFLIFMLLISIYFFNKLLSPLAKLTVYFKEAENGNYSVRSDIENNDEIGMVSRSFNKMVTKTEKLVANLEKYVDNQENIVIVTDGKKLSFANKKMYEFFGYKDLKDFLKEHDSICDKFIHNDRFFYPEKIQDGNNWVTKILSLPPKERIVTMLGSDFNVYAFAVAINEFDENNLIVSFSDISENVIEQIRLEEQTIHDKLTNSYNREYFEKNYKRIIKECKNRGNNLAVAFLDIDHFKNVNDTYGHDIGDDVLVKFVKTIKRYSRQDDELIRWGGEEFILLLRIKTEEDLTLVLENMREKISLEEFSEIGNITCSIGGAIYREGEDIHDTVKRADICVYEAKAAGRNKVIINSK